MRLVVLLMLPLFALVLTHQTPNRNVEKPASQNRTSDESNCPQQTFVIDRSNCKPDSQQTPPQEQAAKPEAFDWRASVNAWSTLVIAIFTAITAWLLHNQIRTVRGHERPWILVTSADRTMVDNDRRLAAHWTIKNFGKSPAFIITIKGTVDIVGNPKTGISEPVQYGALYGGSDEHVLAPGQESGTLVAAMNEPLGDRFGDLVVEDAKLFIVFYGIVEYRDIFKCKHQSRFSYTYSFQGRKQGFFFKAGPPKMNDYT